jgi:hypothetical protein
MHKLFQLAGLAAFWGALALAGLAAVELVLQHFGGSLIGRVYSAGRLFEFAGITMVLAIGIHLREQGMSPK